VLNTT
jgi:mannosyl-oligosaccharide alpha-1,3-glucosidase